MKVLFKKESADVILPKKATEGSAAYDVYVPCDYVVRPGRNVMPLQFRVAVPYGYEMEIEPRSGFSVKGMEGYEGDVTMVEDKSGLEKKRFDCDVKIGKIDSDYRGVVGVIMYNRGGVFTIEKGTRICQSVFRKVEDIECEVVDSLPLTERGEGGFGHSGTK